MGMSDSLHERVTGLNLIFYISKFFIMSRCCVDHYQELLHDQGRP